MSKIDSREGGHLGRGERDEVGRRPLVYRDSCGNCDELVFRVDTPDRGEMEFDKHRVSDLRITREPSAKFNEADAIQSVK